MCLGVGERSEAVFHIRGRDGVPVMPTRLWVERERDRQGVARPRPALGELRSEAFITDGVEARSDRGKAIEYEIAHRSAILLADERREDVGRVARDTRDHRTARWRARTRSALGSARHRDRGDRENHAQCFHGCRAQEVGEREADGKRQYSAAPGPGVILVLDDECIGAGTRFRPAGELRGRRVLELPHGAAEGIGDLTRCWRMAEGVGEGCRWRDWSLGGSRETRKRALIVMDENRSMLKNGPVAPPLGAPRELFSIDHELAGGGRVETGRRTRRRRASRLIGYFGLNAEAVQARDEHTVYPIVRLAKVAGFQGGASHD